MAKLPSESTVQGEDVGGIPSREAVSEALTPRSTIDRPAPARRRPRFGGSKLGVDCSKLHDAGFYCHWINDYPGRVNEALDSGYTHVSLSEVESGPVIGAPSATGEAKVSRRVGVTEDGRELLAYLMKIPLDWKQDNDAYYQERADKVDRAIKAGKIEQVENAYHPGGDKISYTARTR